MRLRGSVSPLMPEELVRSFFKLVEPKTNRSYTVLPYIKGLTEPLRTNRRTIKGLTEPHTHFLNICLPSCNTKTESNIAFPLYRCT